MQSNLFTAKADMMNHSTMHNDNSPESSQRRVVDIFLCANLEME